MLDIRKRSNLKELLDGNNIPFDDLALNMRELNTINTYLGGHAITLQGFKTLLGNRKKISVLEIGCGGGDNLQAIEQYCIKQKIDVELFGIDIQEAIIKFAKLKNSHYNFIEGDYQFVELPLKPDILFSSLFCHHFSDIELVNQLNWMSKNSQVGFFINDLHRHSLAYFSIKWLTAMFSNSYLVKNDAPISVLRGFTILEWKHLFKKASISNFTIAWKWAFRHLVIVKHEGK